MPVALQALMPVLPKTAYMSRIKTAYMSRIKTAYMSRPSGAYAEHSSHSPFFGSMVNCWARCFPLLRK